MDTQADSQLDLGELIPFEGHLHSDPWEADAPLATLLWILAVVALLCAPPAVIAFWTWAL